MMPKIIPVILCGGSGTRLWPLSRTCAPKQFMTWPKKETLFAKTLQRALSLGEIEQIIVLCQETQRFQVLELAEPYDASLTIILEPEARNTAPALALASLALLELEPSACMLVLPSDQELTDLAAFKESVAWALPLALEGQIVTFGIEASTPETGFGYIERGHPLGQGFAIARFVEKPDQQQASAMLATGRYYYNSGLFLLKPQVYLAELKNQAPDLTGACTEAWQRKSRDGHFLRPEAKAFLSSPSNSIDYAVMEKTKLGAVVPLASPWSDLGSFEALYQIGQKDEAGNVSQGDVWLEDTKNSLCLAKHRLLAAIGLNDLIVAETSDAVLVAARSQ
ncbi:MAG: mannose-1-phosphate guanylyltransferase/mannose-6-phosphate isomerase, partial [Desulfovibrio sp.]|nr:mannose-1-phosphate guanylyltransferase/mannose-6-phosphate isomerase [Desulfovibrio sp.]